MSLNVKRQLSNAFIILCIGGGLWGLTHQLRTLDAEERQRRVEISYPPPGDKVVATVFVPNGRTFPTEIKATGLVVIKLGELQIQEADTKKTWTFSPGTWYMRSE